MNYYEIIHAPVHDGNTRIIRKLRFYLILYYFFSFYKLKLRTNIDFIFSKLACYY